MQDNPPVSSTVRIYINRRSREDYILASTVYAQIYPDENYPKRHLFKALRKIVQTTGNGKLNCSINGNNEMNTTIEKAHLSTKMFPYIT